MVDSPYMLPGVAHPHPPLAAEDLADRLGVHTDEVLAWLQEGLPCTNGLIDPFETANWLCWGHLDRCPLLQRRWQTYIKWFMPHIKGSDTRHQYRVRQVHRLYLPEKVQDLLWYVPRIAVTHTQPEVRQLSPLMPLAPSEQSPDDITEIGPFSRLSWKEADPETTAITSEWVVRVDPQPVEIIPDHAELREMVRSLVADFHYQYRHHQPGEDPYLRQPLGKDGMSGSCLDCALELGRRLSERGREWRLCAGLVANSAIANPHFWLKVDTMNGWTVVDPSLPAIARMLGQNWQAFVEAYVGGCDARRITLTESELQIPSVPGGASLGSRLGEVIANVQGRRFNAWACLDWVCGECLWSFH
jgi:hypothetical protein